MRLRFKMMLTIIFILILGCSFIGVGYLFYTKVIHDDTIVIADGNITINFLNGNEFSATEDKTLQFSVTNNGRDQASYYIQISDVKGNTDTITYEIISTDSNVEVSSNLKSEIVSNYITIDGNKTDNYTVAFKTDGNEAYSGKIIVGVKQEENTTLADIILKNNEVKKETLSKIGESATNDEGLIESKGDLGTAYYFRGNVSNNYVTFAGHNWRIVKINGDGSIKLVLDAITDVLSKYYEDNNYSFAESKIYESLENWYNINLANYSDYIASYKFCNDLLYDNDSNTYQAYNRIITDNIPIFMCIGDTGVSKIGLLTADEVMLAGASINENKDYYLYNSSIETDYFTMTSAKSDNSYYPFAVGINGALKTDTSGTVFRGVRPVINIIHNINVTGDGTKENPYVIDIDKKEGE